MKFMKSFQLDEDDSFYVVGDEKNSGSSDASFERGSMGEQNLRLNNQDAYHQKKQIKKNIKKAYR